MRLLLCCVPFDDGKSGISVYIRSVISEMEAQGHKLTLIVEEKAERFFPGYDKIVLPKLCNKSFISVPYCLYILPSRIVKKDYDRLIILAANRRMISGPSIETYGVVHDLSQYHVPVKYDLLRVYYIKHFLSFYLRKYAGVVVAISKSTAKDLIHYWKVPTGKIVVNYNGIDRSRLPLNQNDASEKTVLYVSRIEYPGKNHENLIRAWELLPDSITGEYKLVIAGSDWPGAEKIHDMAKRSPKANSIVFPGFISNELLYECYKHCSLYVFPSFYEGFGLSLIEAMASGAVCACSNNSSLGEIAGDAALTFDPASPEEIARSIEIGLTDKELRSTLRERALKREKKFTWDKHVQVLTAERVGYAEIFGCRFSTCTMNQALGIIDSMIADYQGIPKVCAFVNADCLNQYYTNREYAGFLAEADIVFPDGIGVALAAKNAYTPVQENVNGTDMLPLLCRKTHSIYLLGAAPGVAEKAKERLEAEHPGVRIVGAEHGYFTDADAEKDVLARINKIEPDILLVAMGVPRQEKWIFEHRDELQCKVAIGVGGLFDFASGRIPRAPMWMQKLKIEWTYRLYNEPIRLFRRYIIGNPLFLWRVFLKGSKNLYNKQERLEHYGK